MASFYNDGALSFGSSVLPITGLNGTLLGNYIAENITVNYPSTVIEVRNAINEPAGWVGVSGFIAGSSTLQIGSGQATPHNGAVFGFNGSVFALSEVGDTRTQADIFKASVSFRKKYN
jgi:hypothetical protein